MSGYSRSGPSPMLIAAVGALIVFGGYFVWTGFLSFLEDQGNITAPITRQAITTATAGSSDAGIIFPTAFIQATFTPMPTCQFFVVNVERAVYRECPQMDDRACPIVEVIPNGTELCSYGRVPNNPEWFVIDLNAGGVYRDLVYIHESVVAAKNPTPTPTITLTPRPTITPLPTLSPTPSPSPAPTEPPTLTPTIDPARPTLTPTPVTPTPTISPTPTAPRIII